MRENSWLTEERLSYQASIAPCIQFNSALFVSNKMTVAQYNGQTWRCDGWIILLPALWLQVRVLPLLIITTNLLSFTCWQSSPHSLSLSLSCAHFCELAAQHCLINVEFLLDVLPLG
jgi:hypothetical protein